MKKQNPSQDMCANYCITENYEYCAFDWDFSQG
jgi:hypothetical protein